jgi:hypothetical protein
MKAKTTDEIEIAKARAHLSAVAQGLALKFGPRLAASLMFGAATGLIDEHFGGDAPAWFREIADELERSNAEGEKVFTFPPAGRA